MRTSLMRILVKLYLSSVTRLLWSVKPRLLRITLQISLRAVLLQSFFIRMQRLLTSSPLSSTLLLRTQATLRKRLLLISIVSSVMLTLLMMQVLVKYSRTCSSQTRDMTLVRLVATVSTRSSVWIQIWMYAFLHETTS